MTSETLETLGTVLSPPREKDGIKTLMDKRPGHIYWATDRASFAGCRLIAFGRAMMYGLEKADRDALADQMEDAAAVLGPAPSGFDLMNLYFQHRGNLLALETKVTNDEEGEPLVTCLVTNHLDEDDLEELEEVQRRVNLEMRDWRERKAQERTAEQELQAERNRLIEVGKKAEQYNWKEQVRTLTEELAAARSELSQFKKGAK